MRLLNRNGYGEAWSDLDGTEDPGRAVKYYLKTKIIG